MKINQLHGVCNKPKKIFGMMPHPERNNLDFKNNFFKMLFYEEQILNQIIK